MVKKTCFVIMPFTERGDYTQNHFRKVYDDVIYPAVIAVGYDCVRCDDSRSSSLIQIDILRQLLDAEVVVCDLSSHNPNVMFELGLRQAFDKPVVLVHDDETEGIFDISGFRYITYPKNLEYGEVKKSQKDISAAITETVDGVKNGRVLNSIVKLMSISQATIPSVDKESRLSLKLDMIMSDVSALKSDIKSQRYLSNEDDILSMLVKYIQDLKNLEKICDSSPHAVIDYCYFIDKKLLEYQDINKFDSQYYEIYSDLRNNINRVRNIALKAICIDKG